jgi:hypothetical protein
MKNLKILHLFLLFYYQINILYIKKSKKVQTVTIGIEKLISNLN